MGPRIMPKGHPRRVGVQAGDLGTTDATSSNNQVLQAPLGSAGSQGQGSLAAGGGNLGTDLGQAGDQDGWIHPLKGLRVPERVTGAGERPATADLSIRQITMET